MPPELEPGDDEDADDMDDVEPEYEEAICGGGYCGIGAPSGLGGCVPGGDVGFCEYT
jgi:hypothetical protein